MLCVHFRMFTQSQSITGGEKRARLTLLARQCVESLVRSLIVKTFGSQASEFEANHRRDRLQSSGGYSPSGHWCINAKVPRPSPPPTAACNLIYGSDESSLCNSGQQKDCLIQL